MTGTPDAFSDIRESNAAFAATFTDSHLDGHARRGLALVTCMDSRIDPLAVLGMSAGDMKIIRNAGARVTEDVMRTLILATHLLGVRRILVMPHTDCRMASGSETDIHQAIFAASGIDTRSVEIRTVSDPREALRADLVRIEASPLLPHDIAVAGAVYDVTTGRLDFLA